MKIRLLKPLYQGRSGTGIFPLHTPAETDRRAEGMAATTGMPPALAWYLSANGIEGEQLDSFINPRLRDSLPDPHIMRDAETAINLICNAIELQQPIGIFGIMM